MLLHQHKISDFSNILMSPFNSITGNHENLVVFLPTNPPALILSISLPWNFASETTTIRQRPWSSCTSMIPPSGRIFALDTNNVCPSELSIFCKYSFISFLGILFLYLKLSLGYFCCNRLRTISETLWTACSWTCADPPKIRSAPPFSFCCAVSLSDSWIPFFHPGSSFSNRNPARTHFPKASPFLSQRTKRQVPN